jgi:hypothetical protein
MKFHGDEDLQPDLTPEELAFMERRAKEMIADRLREPNKFYELMAGIDPRDIDSHIHRCMLNLDNACGGDTIGRDAILHALCHVQRRVQQEADAVWMDDCMLLAEKELS